jgi:hypothetical protein
MNCSVSRRRPPVLARLAGPLLVLLLCSNASASTPSDASATTATAPMLAVLWHAGIVYAIAIAISFATALMIKLLTVFLAFRGAETEKA